MSDTTTPKLSIHASPAQMRYAHTLQIGAYAGLVLMIVAYCLYVFGVFAPRVPIETVVANWHLGVHDYLAVTGAPSGWAWITMLGTGDYMTFVGLALLALLTIVCYAQLIPEYLRRKDKAYTFFAVLEILVLSLAASGIVGGGGH